MGIPVWKGKRTYFVLADVEPKETMTFGVEDGIVLPRSDGPEQRAEVLGHARLRRSPTDD